MNLKVNEQKAQSILTEEVRLLNLTEFDSFYEIYSEFSKAPFYEKWTEEMIYRQFVNYLNNGKIYGYNDGKLKGIIALLFGVRRNQPVSFTNPNRIVYLADIIVGEAFRNQGIGTLLIQSRLEELKNNPKYKGIYLCTNYEGSMSEPIALKSGFEVVKDEKGKVITCEVSFPRISPEIPQNDKRKFLYRDLR